jgi:hypothetical protein
LNPVCNRQAQRDKEDKVLLLVAVFTEEGQRAGRGFYKREEYFFIKKGYYLALLNVTLF